MAVTQVMYTLTSTSYVLEIASVGLVYMIQSKPSSKVCIVFTIDRFGDNLGTRSCSCMCAMTDIGNLIFLLKSIFHPRLDNYSTTAVQQQYTNMQRFVQPVQVSNETHRFVIQRL